MPGCGVCRGPDPFGGFVARSSGYAAPSGSAGRIETDCDRCVEQVDQRSSGSRACRQVPARIAGDLPGSCRRQPAPWPMGDHDRQAADTRPSAPAHPQRQLPTRERAAHRHRRRRPRRWPARPRHRRPARPARSRPGWPTTRSAPRCTTNHRASSSKSTSTWRRSGSVQVRLVAAQRDQARGRARAARCARATRARSSPGSPRGRRPDPAGRSSDDVSQPWPSNSASRPSPVARPAPARGAR